MKLSTCPRNKTYNTPSRHACTPSAYNSARITNIYKLPIHLNVCETSAALLLIYVFDTATILGNNLNLALSSQQTDSSKTNRNALIQNRPWPQLLVASAEPHTSPGKESPVSCSRPPVAAKIDSQWSWLFEPPSHLTKASKSPLLDSSPYLDSRPVALDISEN